MADIALLQAALRNANVQAFLRVIRSSESSDSDDEAYRALYGWAPGNGKVFESFATHPRVALMSAWGWTSAAGAYQAMAAVPGRVKTDTWGDFERWARSQGHEPRFDPQSQDLFAVWCINRRGALQMVLDGRVEDAIAACRQEWASFPGAGFGQPTAKLSRLVEVFKRWGGGQQVAGDGAVDAAPSVGSPPTAPTAPAPRLDGEASYDIPMSPSEPAPTQAPAAAKGGPPVLPVIAKALLPQILTEIPRLLKIWPPGSEVADRNVQTATTALDIIVKALGAANAQDAVEKVKSDPDAAKVARDAVDENWAQIDDTRETSVVRAREFAAHLPERVIVFNLVFHELLSLILVMVGAAGALIVMTGQFSNELKVSVVTLIIVGGYVGVKEFWLGGSRGSDVKTAMLMRRD